MISHAPGTPLEALARQALGLRDWRGAAILFTAAADAIPDDVNGFVPARVLGLRRDAHLALCRTEEFKTYRERLHSKGRHNFRDEWELPDGSLVVQLLSRYQARVERRIAEMGEA